MPRNKTKKGKKTKTEGHKSPHETTETTESAKELPAEASTSSPQTAPVTAAVITTSTSSQPVTSVAASSSTTSPDLGQQKAVHSAKGKEAQEAPAVAAGEQKEAAPRYICLLAEVRTTNNILVAEKPLLLGGIPTLIDGDEIAKRFQFTYYETIVRPEQVVFADLSSGCKADDITQAYFRKRIQERLKSPLKDSFVICCMDDNVGCGVFAKKPIKAGTVIGIYAGVIEKKDKPSRDCTYALTTHSDSPYTVNAREFGGFARFIQHLPYSLKDVVAAIKSKKGDIDALVEIFAANDFIFDDESVKGLRSLNTSVLEGVIDLNLRQLSKSRSTTGLQKEFAGNPFLHQMSDLATANLLAGPISLNGIPTSYFVACRDIQEGEQLGFSYGLDYWTTLGVQPRYFRKNGSVIPVEEYPIATAAAAALPTTSSFGHGTLFATSMGAQTSVVSSGHEPSLPGLIKKCASEECRRRFYPILDKLAESISEKGYELASTSYSKSSPKGWLLYQTTASDCLIAALNISQTEHREKLVEIFQHHTPHPLLQVSAMKSGDIPVLSLMFKVNELDEEAVETIKRGLSSRPAHPSQP